MSFLKKIKIWGLTKKDTDSAQPELCGQIIWYPSNRDVQSGPKNSTPMQVPPLMVRKAAWRR